MKIQLIVLYTSALMLTNFNAALAQPFQAPGSVTNGLFAWYDAKNFDETAQQWNPRHGTVPLLSFTTTTNPGTYIQISTQYAPNINPVLRMENRGLRAQLLPADVNGQYTIFAVSKRRRHSISSTPFKVYTWGFSGQSSYPGYTENPFSIDPNTESQFHFTTSRSIGFQAAYREYYDDKFNISSLSFATGLDQRNMPKIASISGKFAEMDAGNVLPAGNGWVYLNANAAFPPNSQTAQGITDQYHDFAEFIVYNRILSQTERDRVNTYLSLKYGIPLFIGAYDGSRYSIDGVTTLWDDTQGFNMDVVGIGRHAASGLDVRHSSGKYPDVVLATKNEYTTSISTDNTFLLIGDKGTSHDNANPANTTSIHDGKRLKRIWRVQNTGVTDSVRLMTASLVVPDAAQSLDPCAPNRLLVSPDSTFDTYTASKLTPAVLYNTTTPPLFSSYHVTTKFRQGESYFTYAVLNSPGTPYAGSGNTDSQKFDSCPDSDDYYYFTDSENRPVFGIKGLTATQIRDYQVKIAVQVRPQTIASGNSKMMKRLLSVTSLPLPAGVKATIRYYIKEDELTDAQITGGTDIWFKKPSATPDQTVSDFTDDGALTPGTFSQMNGIRGVQNGTSYVEFANLESFSTFGFISSSSAMPVKLTSFTGRLEQQNTLLSWQTSSEINADHFEIQRSEDTKGWQNIGIVKTFGGMEKTNQYKFTDQTTPDGINYYRLKMVDKDGTFSLSRMISIQNKNGSNFLIYPNPPEDKIIRLKDLSAKPRKIKGIVFVDPTGIRRLFFTQNLNTDLNVNKLQQGIYTVVITMENGEIATKKLIIAE